MLSTSSHVSKSGWHISKIRMWELMALTGILQGDLEVNVWHPHCIRMVVGIFSMYSSKAFELKLL